MPRIRAKTPIRRFFGGEENDEEIEREGKRRASCEGKRQRHRAGREPLAEQRLPMTYVCRQSRVFAQLLEHLVYP